MAIIAAFDLGTTALKCAVVDDEQNVLFSGKENIKTYESDSFIEQNPEEWWSAFLSLSSRFDTSAVDYIIFSGQMQDLYFVDKDGHSIGNAVLYNDQRGKDYVDRIPEYVGKETSINIDGSIPITKMLWFKDHSPETLEKAEYLMISAKDYLIFKLTGNSVSDATNMATSGMMDIKTKEYIDLEGFVDGIILPAIRCSDEIAGRVLPKVSGSTGYRECVEVFVGSGDAGATTLASGVTKKGEFSVNLGTSGWVAAISDSPMEGVFNLPAINRGLYINVIPVLNAAVVHNWVARFLFGTDEDRYSKLHELLSKEEGSNRDLICMPYLVGERFPVADDKVRGVFIGADLSTTKADFARSALEGVAFSLRQGLEKQGIKATSVSLIGGGAAESAWDQIMANVFNSQTKVFGDSDVLPSIMLSSVVLYGKGIIKNYDEFILSVLEKQECKIYHPDEKESERYDLLFERFKRIYPSIKNCF